MTYGTLIQTVTVGAGGAGSITFSAIPQTFTDLVVLFSIRGDNPAITDPMALNINGSGSTAKILSGNGSAASSTTSASNYGMSQFNGSTSTASTFSNGQIYIPNYTTTGAKSVSIDSTVENNATSAFAGISAILTNSTTAITTIQLGAFYNLFQQYSTASLYGLTHF
jgi:hypothetical protein